MFNQPPLPYAEKALEPWLSKDSIHYHYSILHARYVKKLNQLTRGTNLAQLPLEDLVVGLDRDDPGESETYKMAAQVWNHDFLWRSMAPSGGGKPMGLLGDSINQVYGSYREFRALFHDAAATVFGSGWVWVITDHEGVPQIWAGSAADNPLRYNHQPLFTCDLWEHAYYLNYPADRADFVDAFLNHLVNWEFAQANYERLFS